MEKTVGTRITEINPMAQNVYYPYTDIYDGLQFVLEGTYGDIFSSYTHNDNYNSEEDGGIYPLEANKPYALQGFQRSHIHLTRNLLDSWIAGNISAVFFTIATFFAEESVEEVTIIGFVLCV